MTLRVAIADDSALLRRGLAALLEAEGITVVCEAGDAAELLSCVERERPDAAVVDIRMPPGYATEGIEAAREIRRRYPQTGVLLLSQYVETENAMSLFSGGAEGTGAEGTGLDGAKGLGYLLKERVSDVEDFLDALRRVAAGGTAVDPELVSRLVSRPQEPRQGAEELSGRELEVLELMAEGRTNQAISRCLFLGERTVEAHIRSIFVKFNLRPEPEDHRRVLAVLSYLRSGGGRR
ncbi:response regulator transcription factor [Arthrobacter cupressi]|uniref:Serine/threonine protein kinase n=1 Tax=Arthrobacter cupressi TaxID=1045773 RepID=A0A1G8K5G2_9MICC|nr:response regulator transcription factor [Arthrobacter cupressi]NYD77327.1 serine/threonine-protein kinase [Arthrobacter cupressi]SDI38726.1 serine/threonine protein kinase [Arthrobacter cupressi]